MATFVNDLRLKEIATGDEAGTWGTSTNTNLELIGEAMGVGAEAVANASTHTITMADGAADQFRSTFLRLTGGGQACTVTLAPNTLSHTWIMRNETAAALTLTQGSGANVVIAAGQTKIVATDGAGSGAIVYEMDDLELAGNLAVGGDINLGDDILMLSDAAAIKFGADSEVILSHVADTGLLLNSTMGLFFNDGSQFINSPNATTLDINATDEIELNATLIDVNGNLDVSGTALVTGVLTTTAATVFNGGFASNAASTITVGDNSDTLSLISTDADASQGPILNLYRNSASPADNDLVGSIKYVARNDNSQDVVAYKVDNYITDVSDGTEDAAAFFYLMEGGALRERQGFTATETAFNEDSVDVDFRVESNGNANMLFVDGGNNRVGIGTNSPNFPLQLDSSRADATFDANNLSTWADFKIQGDTASGNARGIYFDFDLDTGDDRGAGIVGISGDAAGGVGSLAFITTAGNVGAERVRILSDGNVVVGGTSAAAASATTIDQAGGIRGVYATGVGGDTLLGAIGGVSNGYQITCTSGNAITYRWHTGGNVNAMTLASTGDLFIGSAAQILHDKLGVTFDGTNDNGLVLKTTRAAMNSAYVVFVDSSAAVIGSITQNAESTVSYATSSDQRLKENISDSDDSGSTIDAIKIRKFDWIKGGAHEKYGFIAQELNTVVPNAVSQMGMPDEEDPMLGVDPSKLMGLAIKEIQSLRARIAKLEA